MASGRGSNIRSIRVSPQMWAMIDQEAKHAGVTTAQFIREAAFARATVARTLRGGDEAHDWMRLYAAVHEATLEVTRHYDPAASHPEGDPPVD